MSIISGIPSIVQVPLNLNTSEDPEPVAENVPIEIQVSPSEPPFPMLTLHKLQSFAPPPLPHQRSLKTVAKTYYTGENNIQTTLTQREIIEGNLQLLSEGCRMLKEIHTLPQDPTFSWHGKEYYQPQFTLGSLAGKAYIIAKRLGYWRGEGAFLVSEEKGPPTAGISFTKREDYARKAYKDLAKKWNLGPMREDLFRFRIPLKWYQFIGEDELTIEERERRWKCELQKEVCELCGPDGLPLDPAIERIFIPSPEERREIYGKPPELIANSDAIYFVYKPAQRNDLGQLIPPSQVPSHVVSVEKSKADSDTMDTIHESKDTQMYTFSQTAYLEESKEKAPQPVSEDVPSSQLLPSMETEKDKGFFLNFLEECTDSFFSSLGMH